MTDDPFEYAKNPDPPSPRVKAGPAVSDDPFEAAKNPLPVFLKSSQDTRRPWAEVAEGLTKLGQDPETHRQDYMLGVARQKYTDGYENLLGYVARRSVPGFSTGFAFGESLRYQGAKKRFHEGKATEQDFDDIAAYEKLKEIESNRKGFDQFLSTIAAVPAMAGEALAAGGILRGGAAVAGLKGAGASAPSVFTREGVKQAVKAAPGEVARGAGRTPFIPSLYLANAAKRAEENGGDWYDPKNLGVALTYGAVQSAVLGHSMKLGAGRSTLASRALVAGSAGTAEQQAGDVFISAVDELLPEAYQTRTKYGAIGKLLSGDASEYTWQSAAQMLSFAAVGGLQKKPAGPLFDSYSKAVDDLQAKGYSRKAADAYLHQIGGRLDAAVKAEPDLTSDRAVRAFDGMRNGPVRTYMLRLADSLPGAKVLTPEARVLEEGASAAETRVSERIAGDRQARRRAEIDRVEQNIRDRDEQDANADFQEFQEIRRANRDYSDADAVLRRAYDRGRTRDAEQIEANRQRRIGQVEQNIRDRDSADASSVTRSRGDVDEFGRMEAEHEERVGREFGEFRDVAENRSPRDATGGNPPIPRTENAQNRPGSTISAPGGDLPTLAAERSSSVRTDTPEAERLYRVPDYKGTGSNVEAALDELSLTRGFSGKWFSKGREQNAGYHTPGRVQFEFDPARMTEGEVKPSGNDALVGSETPAALHPALAAVRYKGKATDDGYADLKRRIDTANAERADRGLEPIRLEATEAAKTEPAKPAPKPKAPEPAESQETPAQYRERLAGLIRKNGGVPANLDGYVRQSKANLPGEFFEWARRQGVLSEFDPSTAVGRQRRKYVEALLEEKAAETKRITDEGEAVYKAEQDAKREAKRERERDIDTEVRRLTYKMSWPELVAELRRLGKVEKADDTKASVAFKIVALRRKAAKAEAAPEASLPVKPRRPEREGVELDPEAVPSEAMLGDSILEPWEIEARNAEWAKEDAAKKAAGIDADRPDFTQPKKTKKTKAAPDLEGVVRRSFPDAESREGEWEGGRQVTAKVGGRLVRFNWNPERKAVEVDFTNDVPVEAGYEAEFAIGREVQKGSLDMARGLNRVLADLRDDGRSVYYVTDPRRHAAYERAMKRAGYEQSGPPVKDDYYAGEDLVYTWKPAEKKPASEPDASIPPPDHPDFTHQPEKAKKARREREGVELDPEAVPSEAMLGDSILEPWEIEARNAEWAKEDAAKKAAGIDADRPDFTQPPPPMALGFVFGPPGMHDFFNKLVPGVERFAKWALGGGKAKNVPANQLDLANILPRFQKWDDFKTIFADPQGAGRVPGLRRLLDPRGTDRSPEGQAINARAAAKTIGENVAALWAQTNQNAKAIFPTAPDGSVPLANGHRGFISDVIEAEMRSPGSQQLTPEQRSWVRNVWTPLLRDAQKMMRDEGVAQWVDHQGHPLSADAAAYFPRPAVGKEGLDAPSGSGQGPGGATRPGSKAFFEKTRKFASERDGVESAEKLVYDPDPASRVAKFISGVYRSVADHRLANDQALQGRKDTNYLWLKEAPVLSAPAFQGKVYPAEIAKKLQKAYGEGVPNWLRGAEQVSTAAKGAMLALDFSAPFTQGLAVMYSNPVAWAKAVTTSAKALARPEALANYLSVPENLAAAKEFAQLGGAVGRLGDFMAGLEKGHFTTKLPLVGGLYEATGRAYGAFMDVAKVEMWKAWRDVTPPEQRAAAVEAVESMLFTGRQEGIGLTPGRLIGERLMLLAPSYYRGGANLVATAFQGGVPGRIARRAVAAYAGGVTMSAVAGMLAVGLSWDEIQERLNPTRGKFLKVPVQLGDGKKVEVGFGNILSSTTRLLGETAEYATKDQPLDTGVDGNPVLQWLRGKSAFLPRLGVDLAVGKDYFGNRVGAGESTLRAFEPLVVQQLLHGEGAVFEKGWGDKQQPGRANAADALASFFGMQSFPGSAWDARRQYLDAEAAREHGQPYSALSFRDRAVLAKRMENDPKAPEKAKVSPAAIERAFAQQAQRSAKLRTLVSPGARAMLDEFKRELPAYTGSVAVGGVDVPLRPEELQQYERLLAEEYDRTVLAWDAEALRRADGERRGEYARRTLERAKERARSRLLQGPR